MRPTWMTLFSFLLLVFSPAARAQGPAPLPPSCEPAEGLAPLLGTRTVLLLGEMHGTEQSPRFVGMAVCHALRKGLPVTVALEIPRGEEPAGEAFLASAGTDQDRAALLTSPFWNRDYQDGRSSHAMLALIGYLRGLVRAGFPVRMRWIDVEEPMEPRLRDRKMAERIVELTAEREGFIVVLTGNLHNRMIKGTPFNKDFEPMGWALTQLRPRARIISLDVSYSDGQAWACMQTEKAPQGECGVWPMRAYGKGQGTALRVIFADTMSESGHHGYYYIGAITASSPAVPPKEKPVEPAAGAVHHV